MRRYEAARARDCKFHFYRAIGPPIVVNSIKSVDTLADFGLLREDLTLIHVRDVKSPCEFALPSSRARIFIGATCCRRRGRSSSSTKSAAKRRPSSLSSSSARKKQRVDRQARVRERLALRYLPPPSLPCPPHAHK
jgi:hypothetical protein